MNCVTCNGYVHPETGCEYLEVLDKVRFVNRGAGAKVRIVRFCHPDCMDTYFKRRGYVDFIKNAEIITMR
jgi:hypothetical protein